MLIALPFRRISTVTGNASRNIPNTMCGLVGTFLISAKMFLIPCVLWAISGTISNMLQKVRDIVALSESSSTESDDDKPPKLGDMSCPTSEEPYYFSARSTESVTKQYGREVS